MNLFAQYSARLGRYTFGPVESNTETFFGVWSDDPATGKPDRRGPVAEFGTRSAALHWMGTQRTADGTGTVRGRECRTMSKFAQAGGVA